MVPKQSGNIYNRWHDPYFKEKETKTIQAAQDSEARQWLGQEPKRLKPFPTEPNPLPAQQSSLWGPQQNSWVIQILSSLNLPKSQTSRSCIAPFLSLPPLALLSLLPEDLELVSSWLPISSEAQQWLPHHCSKAILDLLVLILHSSHRVSIPKSDYVLCLLAPSQGFLMSWTYAGFCSPQASPVPLYKL